MAVELVDPVYVYKPGYPSRRVHRIDLQAWLDDGYTLEPPKVDPPPDLPVETPKPLPTSRRKSVGVSE